LQKGKLFYKVNVIALEANNTLLNWEYEDKWDRNRITHAGINKYIATVLADLKQNTKMNLPILIYSKTEFAPIILKTSVYENKYKLLKYNQLSAYNSLIKLRIYDLSAFINWFEAETDYENTIRLDENPQYRSPQLQTIRQAITFFLTQLNQSQFKNLRVKKRKSTETGLGFTDTITRQLIISKNNIDLDLTELSSGEKSVLLLAIDIAMRLAMANPSRENALEGDGIILIDEIELHLHPQWQRQIIPALMATFPNCQFIVTTHSPQVVSQVKRENILILDNNQLVQNVPFTYGKDSNTLLNEVFQTPERPIEIQKQLDKCFKLIDMENLVEAKKALRHLAMILGENDPEILRANAML
jgi:predicted ATP-binding protein involved in virulence